MIVPANNSFVTSKNPHSIATRLDLSVPSPGFDSNPLVRNMKQTITKGMSGLTFDGTGLFGSGLFSGDITSWGTAEIVAGAIGLYAIYAMFFQAKQTKYRAEMAAGRYRKRKAARLREKAKKLEEQTTGIF